MTTTCLWTDLFPLPSRTRASRRIRPSCSHLRATTASCRTLNCTTLPATNFPTGPARKWGQCSTKSSTSPPRTTTTKSHLKASSNRLSSTPRSSNTNSAKIHLKNPKTEDRTAKLTNPKPSLNCETCATPNPTRKSPSLGFGLKWANLEDSNPKISTSQPKTRHTSTIRSTRTDSMTRT